MRDGLLSYLCREARGNGGDVGQLKKSGLIEYKDMDILGYRAGE